MDKISLVICQEPEELDLLGDGYPLLLAFSSDTLFVVDKEQQQALEWVIVGKDNNGWVAQASDEDEFLDGLLLIKRAIQSGINPAEIFGL